jgi:hypothetical protein
MFEDRDDPAQPTTEGDDRPIGAPITVRLSSGGRGTVVLAALIATFLAVAVVKPWGGVRAPRPLPMPTAAPTVAPSIDPLASLRRNCDEPPGWRIYSRDHWAGMTVRSWRAFDPASSASGPLDPTIPVVPVVASTDALGYCSPWTAGEKPPNDATVVGWRVVLPGADGTQAGSDVPSAEQIALRPVDPSWATVVGAWYEPPVDRRGRNVAEPMDWPAGRYIFAIRGTGYARWWAVDIELPVILKPSARPAASAPPTP